MPLFISSSWLFFIFLAFTIIPIAALIDIAKSEFKQQNQKFFWLILVGITWMLGGLIYFAIGKKQKAERILR